MQRVNVAAPLCLHAVISLACYKGVPSKPVLHQQHSNSTATCDSCIGGAMVNQLSAAYRQFLTCKVT